MKSALFTSFSLAASVAAQSVITRDVAVIGGGAAGTFTAIRLQQMGFSVACIEKSYRLGGHVDTYRNPTNHSQFVDYGVQIFTNETVVHDYFGHFNISLKTVNAASSFGSTNYYNFIDGSALNTSSIMSGDLVGAFTRYVQILNKYSYINGEWNLPNPVPEDLLLPWGEFVIKHNLTAMATVVYQFNAGQGNILAQPALYVIRQLSLPQIQGIASGFLVNPLGNQELYDRALTELGSSAFLNSTVTSVIRSDDGVEVCFDTDQGHITVKAKKLVIAIPPKAANLQFLDLSDDESLLFGQFNNSYYWDALLSNTGLPKNTLYFNLNPDAPLNVPAQPVLLQTGATAVDGITGAYYASAQDMTDDAVRADILATFRRLQAGLGIQVSSPLEIVALNNHSPYTLTVTPQAIRDGFYNKLKKLQGQHNTFFTGAMWANDASGEIWDFTEKKILPRVQAALAA
ncbi:flavin-containing superfamily Amine oxidase like protein [Zymoseptoria brevis]|uniref:Flavin-containing superfamily Amine oxidase like protein n=1 Tax=Zymoseptoria brevis TaxID=1047168 RepID=A0A0F4G7P7_9PEZI|nr:flavin-containing superfamily Amine oxidase like protein [Zymoseptoria brevis]